MVLDMVMGDRYPLLALFWLCARACANAAARAGVAVGAGCLVPGTSCLVTGAGENARKLRAAAARSAN